MNKDQLKQFMSYLDMEYTAILNRMPNDERKMRYQHWAREIGPLEFNPAMVAIRKLSRGQYMPRTGEVIAEVEKMKEFIAIAERYKRHGKCSIYRDAAGDEILELDFESDSMTGYLNSLPNWMQIKFRWLSDPTPANTEAWETYIMTKEKHDKFSYPGMFPEVDLIMEGL